jgi:hypothetical protein
VGAGSSPTLTGGHWACSPTLIGGRWELTYFNRWALGSSPTSTGGLGEGAPRQST